MPLWIFSHTRDTFTNEDKQDLVDQITRLYTRIGLPAFYVNVQFFELSSHDIFVGGVSPPMFTTLSIYHVARSMQDAETRDKFLGKVDSILNPRFKSKGIGWEYFVQEAPRELWKINGISPPPTGSELENIWLKQNRPVEEGELKRSIL
jgi:phenylpyruvate tautomerase PptA (4-oxalocrotonate tautomerase family)